VGSRVSGSGRPGRRLKPLEYRCLVVYTHWRGCGGSYIISPLLLIRAYRRGQLRQQQAKQFRWTLLSFQSFELIAQQHLQHPKHCCVDQSHIRSAFCNAFFFFLKPVSDALLCTICHPILVLCASGIAFPSQLSKPCAPSRFKANGLPLPVL
jgi:hypothetical protein